MRHFTPVLALLAVLAIGGAASAQTPATAAAQTQSAAVALPNLDLPFNIRAELISYEKPRALYSAEGDVQLTQPGRSLRADWIEFNRNTNSGRARGQIVLEEEQGKLFAEELQFSLEEDLQATVQQGRLESAAGLVLHGDVLQKHSDALYTIKNARFTTCNCPEGARTPWEISAREAELELDGYATLRDAKVHILGAPVLWLPWFKYPAKRTRQSGWLLPEFGQSARGGFDVGAPYFWAARENINLTFTPRWTEKRGWKPELRTEYVFGENSGGELWGGYLPDDPEADGAQTVAPFGERRWALALQHKHHLPFGINHKSKIYLAGDNRYAYDFREWEQFRNNRFLESSTLLEKQFGARGQVQTSLEARFAEDIGRPESLDRDAALLHRAPEFRISALPFAPAQNPRAPWLGFDARYTHFASREGTRGQRLLFNPRVEMPLRAGPFVFAPALAYHGASYRAQGGPRLSRHLWSARAELSTRLQKRFQSNTGGAWLHVVRPALRYVHLAESPDEGANPLFEARPQVLQTRIRQLAPEAALYDSADRSAGIRALAFVLEQRFYALQQGAPRLLAELEFSAQRDYKNDALRRLLLEGEWFPSQQLHARFHALWDAEKSELAETLIEAAYQNPRGISWRLNYRRVKNIPQNYFENSAAVFSAAAIADGRFREYAPELNAINQAGLHWRWPFAPRWAAAYGLRYAFDASLLLRQSFALEYASRCDCWAVEMEAARDRTRGSEFHLRYRILGLGGAGRRR